MAAIEDNRDFSLSHYIPIHEIVGSENTKKPQQNHFYCGFFVVPPGIEPGTQGFSVLCSTN